MAKSKKSLPEEKTELKETATETPKIEEKAKEEIKAEEKPKPIVREKLPQDKGPVSDNQK